jgi:hypothetical protein
LAQVERIATWKSEHPNPFAELFRRASQPVAEVVEYLLPDRAALAALNAAYEAASRISNPSGIRRRASVQEIEELREKPLEFCDGLAREVGHSTQGLATVEGAVTGAGGIFTTLIDIPLIFVLCVRTIIRTGHCYGYTLNGPNDKAWVLGAVAVALSSTKAKRVERLARLREIEDVLLEEVQEQIVIEEFASLLTQLEIVADIPLFGAATGALLNLSVANRIDRTARHLFQERWLRDNGKLDEVEPAAAVGRAPSHHGWSGAIARAGYSTCYGLGYGITFPGYLAAAVLAGRAGRTAAIAPA